MEITTENIEVTSAILTIGSTAEKHINSWRISVLNLWRLSGERVRPSLCPPSFFHQLSYAFLNTHIIADMIAEETGADGLGLAILTPRWLKYVLDADTAPHIKKFGVDVFGTDCSLSDMDGANAATSCFSIISRYLYLCKLHYRT